MNTSSKISLFLGSAAAISTVAFTAIYISQNTGFVAVAIGVVGPNNTPVQFAMVQLGGQQQITGADGEVVFPSVKSGTSTITVEAQGYEPFSQNIPISSAADSFQVTLTPAQ